MYTYLIVDDEMIERRGLIMLLKRLDPTCQILQAGNGEDALEVLAENEVDVLMTDINMPFLDGMGLIEQTHVKYPDLPTIIFSGYDDFSYAKRAISYGVSEYILKPVNPEEFEETVTKILHKLEESKQLERHQDESNNFVREHLLYLMVSGQSKAALQEKTGGVLGLDFLEEYTRMLLIESDYNCFEDMDSAALEVLEQLCSVKFQYLNLNLSQAVLFAAETGEHNWAVEGEKIADYFTKHSGKSCYAAVSSDLQKSELEISAHYKKLENLMEQRFYNPKQHVFIFLDSPQPAMHADVQEEAERLDGQIRTDLKNRDVEGLQEHFKLFCEQYRSGKNYSQIYIKFMFSNLLREVYKQFEEFDEKQLNRAIDRMYHCTDMQSMTDILQAAINKLQEQMAVSTLVKHREVDIAKQLVRKNYSDSGLGVDQIAAELNITPNYLSSIFKKDTGENLSTYMKRIRMEHAKELLSGTNQKIGDICAACGFVSVSYFCQSFREYFGVSPKRYREQGE